MIQIQKDSLQASFTANLTKNELEEAYESEKKALLQVEAKQEIIDDLNAALSEKIAAALASAKVLWDEQKRNELETLRKELTERFSEEKARMKEQEAKTLQVATEKLNSKLKEQKEQLVELQQSNGELKEGLANSQANYSQLKEEFDVLKKELAGAAAEAANAKGIEKTLALLNNEEKSKLARQPTLSRTARSLDIFYRKKTKCAFKFLSKE